MMSIDPESMVSYRQQELLAEAESERLLSNLPEREPLHLRRKLAMACYRMASWLDRPGQYFQPVESGGEDWAAPCAHA
jgi:hypothetical protein